MGFSPNTILPVRLIPAKPDSSVTALGLSCLWVKRMGKMADGIWKLLATPARGEVDQNAEVCARDFE